MYGVSRTIEDTSQYKSALDLVSLLTVSLLLWPNDFTNKQDLLV